MYHNSWRSFRPHLVVNILSRRLAKCGRNIRLLQITKYQVGDPKTRLLPEYCTKKTYLQYSFDVDIQTKRLLQILVCPKWIQIQYTITNNLEKKCTHHFEIKDV